MRALQGVQCVTGSVMSEVIRGVLSAMDGRCRFLRFLGVLVVRRGGWIAGGARGWWEYAVWIWYGMCADGMGDGFVGWDWWGIGGVMHGDDRGRGLRLD